MRIKERLKREMMIRPVIRAGYSRKMAGIWYNRTQKDFRIYGKKYNIDFIKKIHKLGYLCRSIEKYGLKENLNTHNITDFEYIYISPYNNSFSKWIGDIITTKRMLPEFDDNMRNIYFSIIQRDKKQLILKANGINEKEYSIIDVFNLLEQKKVLELRPAFWTSKRKRYRIEQFDNNIFINGKLSGRKTLTNIIKNLGANYIISDYIDIKYKFSENLTSDHTLKFWVANDTIYNNKVIFATVNLYYYEFDKENDKKRKHITLPVNIESGSFFYKNQKIQLKNWDNTKNTIYRVAKKLKQLSFFTVSVALNETGFQFLHFSSNPLLPNCMISKDFNDYLRYKFNIKKNMSNVTLSYRIKAIKDRYFIKFIEKFCRKGVRPYMQKLWFEAVKNDFLHTNGVPLHKKIWAWKRGFLSYRTYQYGLSEENYKEFLSDYDYYWLNRINNYYQIWINDKTTFRYILEPFNKYIPEYYFSIFKRNGNSELCKLIDCPNDISETYEGIFNLLKKKGKLAMKPSSGTHGDGFYCLSFEVNRFFVNGEEKTIEEIVNIIESLKSFYIITEYLVMSSQLKTIYPKSVNTIRVMVINRKGYNPKIMQAYMRIGSSGTGYTDNVGYGGICVMVNEKTGELFNPETIKDHVFYKCPNHPDTGVSISGFIENWQLVCDRILNISQYLGELEYLGFDIAMTDDGFQILEINIHQDLHKVPTFNKEVKEFFKHKIVWKKN